MGWSQRQPNLGEKTIISTCFNLLIFMPMWFQNIWWYIYFPPVFAFIRLFIQLIGIMRANNSCAAIQMVVWLYGTWKAQVALSKPQYHMVRYILWKETMKTTDLPLHNFNVSNFTFIYVIDWQRTLISSSIRNIL